MKSKKAMSPLIATVLVIAFAVALGVMIMNWSTGIDDDVQANNYCEGLSLSLEQNACYSDSTLSLFLKNNGKVKFDGVIVKSTSDSGDFEIKVKDSAMISRESLTKNVLFAYAGGPITLQVIPYVDVEGDAVACLSGAYSQTELPSC